MKRYSKYKDSGIEWIGEIPSEWKIITIGKVSTVTTGNTPSKNGSENYYNDDNGFLWIKPDNLNYFNSIEQTKEYLNDDGISLARIVPAFTPLVCCIGTIGKFGYSTQDSAYNQQINAIIFDQSRVLWKYGLYSISLLEEPFWFYSNGNVVRILNTENQKRVAIVLPPLSEQHIIVEHLDRKTAAIDELIADKQKLVALLNEKRSAVISEGVIKGIHKTVKMKDSGVVWIGQIPDSWQISRIGFETWVRARLGWKGLKAEEYVDAGYVFLSTPNIKNTLIDFENVNYISKERYDESPEIKLSIGDVLLAKDGSTLGTVNVVRTLPKESTVNSSIAIITPSRRINSVYLYYLFQSDYLQSIIQMKKGGMGVPHLFQGDIVKFSIPLPPLDEQQSIAFYLDQKTVQIDALISDINEQIEKLKEYRQATISEVVTGKVAV